MERKIELGETLEVTSREQTVKLDMTKLPDELIAQAVMHGLTQKIADAAAGAKKVAEESGVSIEDATVSLMAKVVERLEAGEWGATRGGSGLSPVDKKVIALSREQLKQRIDGYKDMTPAQRDKAVWDEFTQLGEGVQAKVRRMAEAEIERERKAKEGLADLFEV